MRAIQITEYGGPEVLTLCAVADPTPAGDAEVVTVTAAGVNYADTHQTENSYLASTRLPVVPGSEVVGRTADGRRVAAIVGAGGYAEKTLVHPATTFEVPDGITDGQALALLVQGLTAWHLLRTCAHVQAEDTVVVHAAAGGVGTLAVQLAKLFGAGRVIGTASSDSKRQLAASLGADATVDVGTGDLEAALEEANGGRKVDVVLEMTGGPVFDASLAALAPFGRLVTYGMASRTPPRQLDATALMARSRAVIGFWLMHCMGRPDMLHGPMTELFTMVADGSLQPVVGATYPLAEARRAHEDLRSRRTVGKLVLDPTR